MDCKTIGCENEGKTEDWKGIFVCSECYERSQTEAIESLTEQDKQVWRALSASVLGRMEISLRTQIPCDEVQESFEKLAEMKLVRQRMKREKGSSPTMLYAKWGYQVKLARSIPKQIG